MVTAEGVDVAGASLKAGLADKKSGEADEALDTKVDGEDWIKEWQDM